MSDEKLLFELPPADLKIAEKKFKQRNPIWTGHKARLIERYLFYFVQITHGGTYIDAFSGPQESDRHEMWSAKLVLESLPRWLKKFYLFDLEESQVEHIRRMVESQPPRNKQKGEPKRKIEIFSGDFNKNIIKMLAENPVPDKEATFCLLDQRTRECDWASVELLAGHKKGGHKIELFYFFPEGWINRSISELEIQKEEKLQKWWGKADWNELLKRRGAARAQFVCERFKIELKYKYAYPFPIYEKPDKGGKVMFYMIHASDHAEAPVLMWRAYGKALENRETDEQLLLLKDCLAKL